MKTENIYLIGSNNHIGAEIKNVSEKDLLKVRKILEKYNVQIKTELELMKGYSKKRKKSKNLFLKKLKFL